MNILIEGNKSGKLEVSDFVFNSEFNGPLIHQVVTTLLSNARSGTRAQKTRSEVRGGGIKPFRQKGTGRARAGTIRSPLWRKGGVVFAARPKSYSQKINRKMYRGALRSVLSELLRQERLYVHDEIYVNTPKTSSFLKMISPYINNSGSTVIITDSVDDNLHLASRNLAFIDVRDVSEIDPVCLVGATKVILTVSALKQIEEMLA